MTRRHWLRRYLPAFVAACLSWPLFKFVVTKRYRPPRKVRIRHRVEAGSFIIEPEFVLFEDKHGPIAISRTCTHLGCTLTYDQSEGQFICPCHQSRFSSTGKYISGPARKDLERFRVSVSDDGGGYVVLI